MPGVFAGSACAREDRRAAARPRARAHRLKSWRGPQP